MNTIQKQSHDAHRQIEHINMRIIKTKLEVFSKFKCDKFNSRGDDASL